MDLRKVVDGYMPRMSHVYRYSSIPVNRPESIAEHSWWVTFLALVIGEDLHDQGHQIEFDILLVGALVHDIDETMSGDIIRSFKHTNQGVLQAIKEASKENVKRLLDPDIWGETVSNDLTAAWTHAKESRLEGAIVSFADQLAVILYCIGERRQGNQNAEVVVSELYHNWFYRWHSHEALGQYADQIFPTARWDDPFCEDSGIKPIMRLHSEGAVSENQLSFSNTVPLS
jgi:5'-deoxynucleotidase YfbR-like HD superfamily hydrolase